MVRRQVSTWSPKPLLLAPSQTLITHPHQRYSTSDGYCTATKLRPTEEGLDCLPARSLDASFNPCLLSTPAVWTTTLGDFTHWIVTKLLMSLSLLHSPLVISFACRSSTRAGGERREGTRRTITHQHKLDREYNYHTQTHTYTPQECEQQEVRRDIHHNTHRQGGNRSVSLLGPSAWSGWRWEGLAGQTVIVTMYQLCHQVSHTFTQLHHNCTFTCPPLKIETYPTDTNIPIYFLSRHSHRQCYQNLVFTQTG